MGMPIITPGTGTRNQAITDLIQSVALQETALSHMLNAEGEKMQAIIAMPNATLEDMMEMNESVNKLVNAVTRLEMMFLAKLELFADQVVPDAISELANINVPSVTIDVPLDDPTAQQEAVAQAIAAAQAQVDPGYTVSFVPTGYNPNGTLTGTFTVTNNTDPTDTATDASDRTITVLSTATDAAGELAKINVTTVTIPVPLDDPIAQQTAVNQAIVAAQAQVDPGYTVSFTPTGYDSTNGLLTGTFTVTNTTDPADTATDPADRTITVVSTPSSATASSNSASQFLAGTLIGGDLSSIPGIDGVTAQYINGVTTGSSVTNTSALDLTPYDQTEIVVNSVTMPISDFLQLGVLNQYAQASIDGASLAFAGAVSDGGVVSIGGSTDFPADASLNLMQLLPVTPLLSEADLNVGAIIGAAQWSASAGNTIASTTSVTNPVQGRTYNIASANLVLDSPLIGDAVNALSDAAATASTAASGLVSDILNDLLGLADTIANTVGVTGISVGSNNLQVDVSLVNLQTELAPLIATPVTSGDGILTVDFSAGTVTVDFNALGLNGQPPNTSLLSSGVIDTLVADLAEVIQTLQATIQALVMSKLTGTAALTITGGITFDVLGIPGPTVDLNYSGSLADFVTNTQPLTFTATDVLAPLSGVIQPLVTAAQSALGATLDPLINDPTTGVFPVLNAAIEAALTNLSNQLSPVFALISDAISIIINVQQDNADGTNTFTEIPIQINLINGSVALNLGKVVVGPNTYTP